MKEGIELRLSDSRTHGARDCHLVLSSVSLCTGPAYPLNAELLECRSYFYKYCIIVVAIITVVVITSILPY